MTIIGRNFHHFVKKILKLIVDPQKEYAYNINKSVATRF